MVLVPKTSASAIPPRMRTSDRIRTYIYNSVTINRLEGGLDYRGIYFSSSYGSRTHILGLEDRCPVRLNEGTIYSLSRPSQTNHKMPGRVTIFQKVGHRYLASGTACCYTRHPGFEPVLVIATPYCDQGETRTLTEFNPLTS